MFSARRDLTFSKAFPALSPPLALVSVGLRGTSGRFQSEVLEASPKMVSLTG